MHKTTEVLLGRLRDAVTDLCDWPIPEEDAVDVAGEITYLAGELTGRGGLKGRLLSELPSGAEGERYRVEERRNATRSYNTNGLLAVFANRAAGSSSYDTLFSLYNSGVVRFQWQWMKLQEYANVHDITLSVAKHEIEDGDPEALIGEVWNTITTVKPKEATP